MSDAISIRRTAFIWLAGLMAAIGICAAAGSYLLARREAADFLDNQLRQVALYVGDTPSAPGTDPDGPGTHDPEDDFIVQVWDASGKPLRQSHPAITIPRQAASGFRDLPGVGYDWRVYTLATAKRTVQISLRMDVRRGAGDQCRASGGAADRRAHPAVAADAGLDHRPDHGPARPPGGHGRFPQPYRGRSRAYRRCAQGSHSVRQRHQPVAGPVAGLAGTAAALHLGCRS
ncbi:hypothetical protein ACHMW4_20000 [Mesorhizobium sp. UC22_110]|uniref:hypothetical protein n=1 Tax=Mesorhizobium sp. UC22_110 TaxID=3374552 RepID=UPI003756CBE4